MNGFIHCSGEWIHTLCLTHAVRHSYHTRKCCKNVEVEYSFLYLYAVFALQVDDALNPPTLKKKQPNNEHLDLRHMESMLQCTVKGPFVNRKLHPGCTSGSAFKCIT